MSFAIPLRYSRSLFPHSIKGLASDFPYEIILACYLVSVAFTAVGLKADEGMIYAILTNPSTVRYFLNIMSYEELYGYERYVRSHRGHGLIGNTIKDILAYLDKLQKSSVISHSTIVSSVG
ncbi:MAG: hypothetical protein C4617_04390 [Candidatus Liberibacter europaeus]|uniref:Uncharacterized protein n=1 Tax=Candidatus Liberibacter europaeus TaxID=744859 RepID=A0A2T4VWV0_9HYPH|nr:hypothetical protein [Candidatus Liberibacter europaeus]PTL86251.1 MAG: hypothetical protein C4617_04390 [Candidatus Liberibacter europaeus]